MPLFIKNISNGTNSSDAVLVEKLEVVRNKSLYVFPCCKCMSNKILFEKSEQKNQNAGRNLERNLKLIFHECLLILLICGINYRCYLNIGTGVKIFNLSYLEKMISSRY